MSAIRSRSTSCPFGKYRSSLGRSLSAVSERKNLASDEAHRGRGWRSALSSSFHGDGTGERRRDQPNPWILFGRSRTLFANVRLPWTRGRQSPGQGDEPCAEKSNAPNARSPRLPDAACTSSRSSVVFPRRIDARAAKRPGRKRAPKPPSSVVSSGAEDARTGFPGRSTRDEGRLSAGRAKNRPPRASWPPAAASAHAHPHESTKRGRVEPFRLERGSYGWR